MRVRSFVVLVLLLAMMMAGCAGPRPSTAGKSSVKAYPAGTDPWPRGDGTEWTAPLDAVFKLASVTDVKIPSFDGILLDAWVLRPDVPASVKVPIVLWSAPYFGLNNQAGNDPTGGDNSNLAEAVPVNLLIEHGYAVAILNLRGSGNSQGCYQLFGSIDWKDNAAAVEWLGTQAWSNGRVGMMGLSYHGTTPWMAAVEAPPHLKTIVTAGQVSQLYTFLNTPEGAHLTIGPEFTTEVNALDMSPPARASPTDILTNYPSTLASKACPGLVGVMTEGYKSGYTDVRDAAFWDDRDILSHYSNIKTSVFLTMGLRDYHGSGHQMQDDYAWANLPADVPKRMLVGQWEHMFPNFSPHYKDSGRDWNATVLPWLDFWLKGVGVNAPGVGTVDYQDSSDEWHTTAAWPPTEGQRRALYLGGGMLGPSAATGTASFHGQPMSEFTDALCVPKVPGQQPLGILYQTAPLENATLFAGNPFALVDVESDLPGGQLAAFVVAISEGGIHCGNPVSESPTGVRFLGMGAADLRHYAGNYVGSNFPVGQSTPVRIDINNFAEVLGVGERLGLLLAFGDSTVDGPNPYSPTLTVHEGGSHLVIPVVSGGLASAPPLAAYPPRPFDPRGGDP
jgi:predicted acyl esterase